MTKALQFATLGALVVSLAVIGIAGAAAPLLSWSASFASTKNPILNLEYFPGSGAVRVNGSATFTTVPTKKVYVEQSNRPASGSVTVSRGGKVILRAMITGTFGTNIRRVIPVGATAEAAIAFKIEVTHSTIRNCPKGTGNEYGFSITTKGFKGRRSREPSAYNKLELTCGYGSDEEWPFQSRAPTFVSAVVKRTK